MKNTILLCALFFAIAACVQRTPTVPTAAKAYTEPYRPQYHFTPANGWMNDPNGLVYNDGTYHLFYQYYPHATVWGPMHWGHAVSTDLVQWQHMPIALYPDENGFVFSGSAVVDNTNTSGLGVGGKAPLIAFFTYFSMEKEKIGRTDAQTQGMAYSLDNGETWTTYADNPIIGNPGIKDFRDPKVFWHHETQSWIMVLVAGDHVKLYRSKNLKQWTHISDFGHDRGSHAGVWECPDLFPLTLTETGETKWVLIISIGNGAPNGGSGTQYFVGDFNGTTFTTYQDDIKWLDWGTDNYAGVTYNQHPAGKRTFIGWMSNWQYALNTPTHPWRSAMTLPRELLLKKVGDKKVLTSYPVETVEKLYKQPAEKSSFALNELDKKIMDTMALDQTKIAMSLPKQDFSISLSNAKGEEFRIIFDSLSNLIMVDRTRSGVTYFHHEFGNKLHYMPLADTSESPMRLEIFMDRSSYELFVNKGEQVMTGQLFPTQPFTTVTVENLSKDPLGVGDFSVQGLRSIWH